MANNPLEGHEDVFQKHAKFLLETAKYTDLRISVEEYSVKVHKCILSLACLTQDLSDVSEIRLTGCPKVALEYFLYFLYSRKITGSIEDLKSMKNLMKALGCFEIFAKEFSYVFGSSYFQSNEATNIHVEYIKTAKEQKVAKEIKNHQANNQVYRTAPRSTNQNEEPDEPFSCPFCAKVFNGEQLAQKHIDEYHIGVGKEIVSDKNENIENSVSVQCKICGLLFNSFDAVDRHVQMRHPSGISSGPSQNTQQDDRTQNSSIEEHTVDKYSISAPQPSLPHQGASQFSKPTEPPYLKKPTPYFLLPTEEPPVKKMKSVFELDNTPESENNNQKLPLPKTWKVGYEVLECNECGDVFATENGCATHYLKMHLNGNHERQVMAQFQFLVQCGFCGVDFNRNHTQYAKHMNEIHHMNEPYNCSLCGKMHFSVKLLRQHFFRAHHSKMYFCPICDLNNVDEEFMKMHMQVHMVSKKTSCLI